MKRAGGLLPRLRLDQRGITSVEYALLLSFLAAGISLAATMLGDAVETEVNDAADCVVADDAGDCLPPPPKCCD